MGVSCGACGGPYPHLDRDVLLAMLKRQGFAPETEERRVLIFGAESTIVFTFDPLLETLVEIRASVAGFDSKDFRPKSR